MKRLHPRTDHRDDLRRCRNLNAVRVLLEAQAARDAALFAADGGVLRELRRLASSLDVRDHRLFHLLLADASGNEALATVLRDVLTTLAGEAGDSACCGDPATAQRAHRAVLDAVLAGRSARAGELARAHIAAAHLAMADELLADRHALSTSVGA